MKNLDSKKAYALLCVFYIVYYITLGVYAPYLNVYFERLGFNGSQIGLITSLGMVASMVITPVWGVLSDKTRNPRGVIALILGMAGLISMVWMTQKEFLPVLILTVVLSMFRQNVWSLVDGVGVQFCSDHNKDFAFARSMGSVGYLLGSFVIANIMFELGFSGPYMEVFIVCSFAAGIMILLMPKGKVREVEKNSDNYGESVKKLLTNKKYLFVLAIMLTTSMVVDCILNYSGNHLINTLGQNDSMIGIFSCAQVLPEVVIVMFANRIFRRMTLKNVFMLGAVAQIVRFVLCAATSNVYVFLLSTTLHGITIAVSSVCYVTYIHKNVDRSVLSTAMASYGAVCTIGSALITQVFGFVYQYGTSYHIFWIGAATAVIAMILILFNKDLNEKA